MAELVPIPFSTLLRRIYHEYTRGESIFDLPKRKFYVPDGSLDLSVVSCGNRAANPVGPAAGPHTQLAQNIVLSWLAGARIIELKTVQVNDTLTIARPCIDMATVGYNTEWSQELTLEDSAREYVKAGMIVDILKRWLFSPGSPAAGVRQDGTFTEANLDTIFDVSVGYDLEGIRSAPIRDWLSTMQDASTVIEELRAEIPDEFSEYRALSFTTKISDSITLSTFHGTPAGEIEHICEFLLGEMGFHVVVKMNPPMLGRERLEELLHGTLGYTDIEVNPKAYDVNIPFDDAVAMVRRLQIAASRAGRTVGVKFGNTLEVLNKGVFLKDPVQYLSGQPLHILHLALVARWREVFGPEFPISFSAGVDAVNFPDCVAIGLVPTTTCTDLLRPGGYGRLQQYLVNLEKRMKAAGASTIDDYRTRTNLTAAELLERSIDNPRYHASNNSKAPRKIGSSLALWDCINCDKCIPVCPNDANFSFDVEPVSLPATVLEITGTGWTETADGVFTVSKRHQIGTYADACNECGNCDVFCPEDGGPYVEKPRFFGTVASYRKQTSTSGFVFAGQDGRPMLYGRFADKEFVLTVNDAAGEAIFTAPNAAVMVDWHTSAVRRAMLKGDGPAERVDMRYYLTMATLVRGMMNREHVNFVTIAHEE